MTQLLAAVGRAPEVKAGLVQWFAASASSAASSSAVLGAGARRSVRVEREPLFLYGRCVCVVVFVSFAVVIRGRK